jgi:hypothetical protein
MNDAIATGIIAATPPTLFALGALIAALKNNREMKPNGGDTRSLGDTVVRLGWQLDAVEKKVQAVDSKTEAQNRVLENHTKILQALTGKTNEVGSTADDTNERLGHQIDEETLRVPPDSPRARQVAREKEATAARLNQRGGAGQRGVVQDDH